MPLINCKVELKLRRTKNCVLIAAGNDSNNAKNNIIIFTIKDIKLYSPVVILSAKDNKKLSKQCKGSERSVCQNEYKTKNRNKNTRNKYRYFIQSNFVGVNILFVWVYLNRDSDVKRYSTQKVLPEIIISSSMDWTFMTNLLVLL